MGKNKLAKFAELDTFRHVFQMPTSVLLSGDGFEWGKRENGAKCFSKTTIR